MSIASPLGAQTDEEMQGLTQLRIKHVDQTPTEPR